MGRDLGYFASEELDRPELNKCPDCECYFATDECPLCGKICPEEMRAGNRAKVKPPKKKKNTSGRVQFIPWYHTWWCILVVFLISRLAGVILFLTSPYSKKAKITVVALVVGGYLLSFAVPIGVGLLTEQFAPSLVNDDISREEYVEKCTPMSVTDYYHDAYNEGNYVTLEVTVEAVVSVQGDTYYLCTALDGGDVKVLLFDCSVQQKTNYRQGEMIRVFGECSGIADYDIGLAGGGFPCLYMAYSDLIG